MSKSLLPVCVTRSVGWLFGWQLSTSWAPRRQRGGCLPVAAICCGICTFYAQNWFVWKCGNVNFFSFLFLIIYSFLLRNVYLSLSACSHLTTASTFRVAIDRSANDRSARRSVSHSVSCGVNGFIYLQKIA